MSAALSLHLLSSLWGALAVSSAIFALGLTLLGDRRKGQGSLVIAAAGLAGLAGANWLAMLPVAEARWAGLAFIGALLLPAAVLMRVEHEAGVVRSRATHIAAMAGVLLPTILLPSQIMRARVCLTPDLCGTAEPFIALMHLGTGGFVLLLALPSLSLLARAGTGALRHSAACWWLALVLVHLTGVLLRLTPTGPSVERELLLAAMLLVLAIVAGVVSMQQRLAEASTTTPSSEPTAVEAQTLPQSLPPVALWNAEACAITESGVTEPAGEAIEGQPALVEAAAPAPADFSESLPPPADAPLVSDPALLSRIHVQALELLRDQRLYRQPQLRRRDLADRLKVPEYLLSRALNASSGQSFTEIVNGLRLDEACARLRNSREPVTTIGYDVGFNSLASFNRAFRDARGCSPSEYRQSPVPAHALSVQAEAA